MRTLFIGGPGNLSEHAARFLLEHPDSRVGIFTLPGSPDKGLSNEVKFYWGNRDNPAQLSEAVDDFKPDLVADFVCYLPEQALQIAELVKNRIDRFVFVSTVDIYGYPLSELPMPETGQRRPTNSRYAENKRKCEEVFSRFHDRGEMRLTIARPSYSFGNEFVISFFSRNGGKGMIARLKAGLPVFVPGDGTTLLHVSAAVNTGRMIGNIISRDKSVGNSYTCAHDRLTTHDGYVELFASALGARPVLAHIPYDLLLSTGRKEVSESILEDVTRHNIAFSIQAFKSDFPAFRWEKSLPDAARDYIRYHEERDGFPPADAGIFEDRLIRAWNALTATFGSSIG